MLATTTTHAAKVYLHIPDIRPWLPMALVLNTRDLTAASWPPGCRDRRSGQRWVLRAKEKERGMVKMGWCEGGQWMVAALAVEAVVLSCLTNKEKCAMAKSMDSVGK